MKIISFSLWGDDPKYCEGAIRNAELAAKIYPDWTCRFYIGGSVPFSVTEELQRVTKHWARYTQGIDGQFEALCGGSIAPQKLQIYHCAEPGDWTGMFWRFYPASEDDVGVFISRDCDSRLSVREAEAVEEWLSGPKLIHVMRDHPEHSTPIMGGMWGAKKGALFHLRGQIEEYTRGDFWQVDQNFLREIIWPANYHKVLAHDDWKRFPQAETKPFPTPRLTDDFIGSILGPNGERLHPEHHASLTSR